MDQLTAAHIFDRIVTESRPSLSGERICHWHPSPYSSIPLVNRLTLAITAAVGAGPVVLMRDMGNAVVHALLTTPVYQTDGQGSADALLAQAIQQALTGDGAIFDAINILDPALLMPMAQVLSGREMHVIAQLTEHVGPPCPVRVQDLIQIEEAADILRGAIRADLATEDRIWSLAVALGIRDEAAWLVQVDEYAEKLEGHEAEDWIAYCDAALHVWRDGDDDLEQPRLFDGEEPGVGGGVGLLEEDVSGGDIGGAAGGDAEDAGGAAYAGDSAGVDDADGPATV